MLLSPRKHSQIICKQMGVDVFQYSFIYKTGGGPDLASGLSLHSPNGEDGNLVSTVIHYSII